MKMKVAIVIPARYQASRFEGKLLQNLDGKPILQHVYERARLVESVDTIIIATDDQRIADSANSYGEKVVLTSTTHRSGTDRVAEVALGLSDIDVVINVQGDEPFLRPEAVTKLISNFENEEIKIASLKTEITENEDLLNPNVVKVVVSKSNNALYFSRLAIPFERNSSRSDKYYRHIGVYGFRRETLLDLAKLEPSSLEIRESLEQLRWLENDYTIKMIDSEYFGSGIDTPEDLKKAKKIINLYK